jgi:DNA polymerase III epsilon subunit-like protein
MSKRDYLFFDIECCDGKHICSFGYVLVDENFNILEKKDILINPEAKFNLGRPGFERIQLSYTPDEFQNKPKFKQAYHKLHTLLKKPNRVFLGHSVGDDIRFLNTACERYKLRRFDIDALDTQTCYKIMKQDRDQMGLERIITELEIDTSGLTAHKSSDDAHMAMLVMKRICQIKGWALSDFFD